MSMLMPADRNQGLTVRHTRKASHLERRAALEVFSHRVRSLVAVEKDRIDSEGLADV